MSSLWLELVLVAVTVVLWFSHVGRWSRWDCTEFSPWRLWLYICLHCDPFSNTIFHYWLANIFLGIYPCPVWVWCQNVPFGLYIGLNGYCPKTLKDWHWEWTSALLCKVMCCTFWGTSAVKPPDVSVRSFKELCKRLPAYEGLKQIWTWLSWICLVTSAAFKKIK